jgi:hypothetical protein
MQYVSFRRRSAHHEKRGVDRRRETILGKGYSVRQGKMIQRMNGTSTDGVWDEAGEMSE